jgi:hypothetical protein
MEYVLNHEMKKLTSLSSDILVALIRLDHWRPYVRRYNSVSCSLSALLDSVVQSYPNKNILEKVN